MSSTIINITLFEQAIAKTTAQWSEYNEALHALTQRHNEAIDKSYWINAQQDSFENARLALEEMLNHCSQNICYLSNILKQVKYDFERADEQGTG